MTLEIRQSPAAAGARRGGSFRTLVSCRVLFPQQTGGGVDRSSDRTRSDRRDSARATWKLQSARARRIVRQASAARPRPRGAERHRTRRLDRRSRADRAAVGCGRGCRPLPARGENWRSVSAGCRVRTARLLFGADAPGPREAQRLPDLLTRNAEVAALRRAPRGARQPRRQGRGGPQERRYSTPLHLEDQLLKMSFLEQLRRSGNCTS